MIRLLAAILLGHAAAADAAALASGRNWRIAVECDAPLVIRMRVHFLGRSGVVEAPVSRLLDAGGKRHLPKSVTWKEGGKPLAQWLSTGGLRNIESGSLGEVELKFDVRGIDGPLRLEFGDIAAFAVARKNACLQPGEIQAPRVTSPARVEKSMLEFRVYRAGYPCGSARRTTEADYPPYLPKQLLLFGRGYLPSAREIELPMGTAPAQAYSYAAEDNLTALERAARQALLADFPRYATDKYFAFNWGSQRAASGNELYSIGIYELKPCPQ